MKEKLLQLVDCGFFDHLPLPKVEIQEKTEAVKADPPSRPCNLSSEIYSNLKLQSVTFFLFLFGLKMIQNTYA